MAGDQILKLLLVTLEKIVSCRLNTSFAVCLHVIRIFNSEFQYISFSSAISLNHALRLN